MPRTLLNAERMFLSLHFHSMWTWSSLQARQQFIQICMQLPTPQTCTHPCVVNAGDLACGWKHVHYMLRPGARHCAGVRRVQRSKLNLIVWCTDGLHQASQAVIAWHSSPLRSRRVADQLECGAHAVL